MTASDTQRKETIMRKIRNTQSLEVRARNNLLVAMSECEKHEGIKRERR